MTQKTTRSNMNQSSGEWPTWTECSEWQNRHCVETTNHCCKQQKAVFSTSLNIWS